MVSQNTSPSESLVPWLPWRVSAAGAGLAPARKHRQPGVMGGGCGAAVRVGRKLGTASRAAGSKKQRCAQSKA